MTTRKRKPTTKKSGGARNNAMSVRRMLAKAGIKSGNGRRYSEKISMPSAKFGRKTTNRSRPLRGGAKRRGTASVSNPIKKPNAPPVHVSLDNQEKKDWLKTFKAWVPAINQSIRETVDMLKDTRVASSTATALGYNETAEKLKKAGWGKRKYKRRGGARAPLHKPTDGRKYKRGGSFWGSVGNAFKKAGHVVADPYVQAVTQPKQFFSKPSNWLSVMPIAGTYGVAGNLALQGGKYGITKGLQKAGLGRGRRMRGNGIFSHLSRVAPQPKKAGVPRRIDLSIYKTNLLRNPLVS